MGACNCKNYLNQSKNEETEILIKKEINENKNNILNNINDKETKNYIDKLKGGKKIINDTKYIIRNEELKFLPQIELYFNKQINITKDNLLQFKKEILNIIQEIDFSIIEIKKGSLKVLLTLQYIILRIQSKFRFLNFVKSI